MKNFKALAKHITAVLSAALALALSGGRLSAQDTFITGVVIDNMGEPLEGATIIVVGTRQWAVTNNNGEFSVQAKQGDNIEVSFLGFKNNVMTVGKSVRLTVRMEEDNKLEEVVVIGYGSVAKKDLTGSVSTVKMEDIEGKPVNSVDHVLQGRIAGADILSTTGEPGSTTSIRIRGSRSITASNEPLIVVDGVMDAIHDLNDINSDDIASISVLKDASSTAIYGSRGSNGVILITTKQGIGIADKTNVVFKAAFGFSRLPRSLDIMNATQFAQYRNDLAAFGSDSFHDDIDWTTPVASSVYSDPYSLGEGTNWIKEITRTAIYQNYALTLSGSTGKSSYYTSFAFNDNEGIIKDSGEKKFTGRLNFDRKVFKWAKLGYKGSYTFRHTDQAKASIGGTSWYSAAQYLSPFIKPTDNYNPLYNSGQLINTPNALIEQNTYYLERHSTNHTLTVKIEPVENFIINSTLSYYLYQRDTYRYYPGTLPAKSEGEGGEAYRAEWGEHSMSSETTAGYKIERAGHSVDFLTGLSLYRFASHSFTLSGTGYMDDSVKWNNMNAVLDKETYSASTSKSEKSKMSYYARVNYNYKSRYYLTATARFDGASNFAENHKWAFFPSAAFKWNLSEEEFLSAASWIDDLSLRLSVGATGNDAISAYQSIAALSSTTSGYLFDGSQPVAFYKGLLDSPDLRWEKTTVYNAALDLILWKKRLEVTLEGYYSKTVDLLLSLSVPTTTGFSSRLTNIGSTSNRGIELTVHSQNILRRNFSWSTDFTFSHNKQMVNDIGSENFISAYDSPGNNSYMMYGYVRGYPLNSLWGFKYGGTWKSSDEVSENSITKTYVSTSTSLGSPRYYDINHDGILNQQDLVYLGNADPYLYGGLQNTFFVHGFTLGVYLSYSLGGKIYNYSEFYMAGSRYANQYTYMLNAWHPTRNPTSDIPRAGGKVDAALPSDFMVHDASYLRIKDVSLSYTFNLHKNWIRTLTLSANGENLYLWKYYNGFDPDVSSSGTSSTLRRLDIGAYPNPRTITFSVQIKY